MQMKTLLKPNLAGPAVDPITLEVIRHGIVSITDQIDANISRTAFSPYIYEYKDFAVGLVGADGELIAQCTGGMPVFVADSVGMAVRDGLAVYGRERLHHGDVVVCNHAAIQGQHLNNTVMYTPIYAGAECGDADRLLRHQRSLDRHRRHHAALQRYFHGRLATALDQALVERRADSRSLSDHRKQHALSRSSCWATSRRSMRAAFSAATSPKRWPTSTVSRPFSAR